MLLAVAACKEARPGGGPRLERFPPPSPSTDTLLLGAQPALWLRDDSAPVLVKPVLASEDARGRLVVGDRSDKDIKIYDASGQRVGTVGKAGSGPGEFTFLSSAQAYGDSLVGYDVALKRLTVFSPGGAPARTLRPQPAPFDVRVLDDSLFLLVRHPSFRGRLLEIVRPDGRRVSEFFDPPPFLEDPQLRFLTAVLADGRDGLVYATLFGFDTVVAFEYGGRMVAKGTLERERPLPSFATLLAAHGGRTQDATGTWFQEGAEAIMRLAVVRGGRVVLQIAPYNTKVGTDILEGGEFVLAHASEGSLATLARRRVAAGLVGTDRSGYPILMGYADSAGTAMVVHGWPRRR